MHHYVRIVISDSEDLLFRAHPINTSQWKQQRIMKTTPPNNNRLERREVNQFKNVKIMKWISTNTDWFQFQAVLGSVSTINSIIISQIEISPSNGNALQFIQSIYFELSDLSKRTIANHDPFQPNESNQLHFGSVLFVVQPISNNPFGCIARQQIRNTSRRRPTGFHNSGGKSRRIELLTDQNGY